MQLTDVFATLTEFVLTLDPVVQFLAVLVIGTVPFLEAEAGAMIGIITGVPVALAVGAAIVGNMLAVLVAVRAGTALATRRAGRREEATNARRDKVMARVDRYGVPVASLLAPTILPISFTAFFMSSAGLSRRQVLVWQAVTVVAWTVLFALLATGVLVATR